MALGDDYITRSELSAYLVGSSHTAVNVGHDDQIDAAIAAATAAIDDVCGRHFNLAASATARLFRACSTDLVEVDDIATTTGLAVAVDTTDDGTFDQTWAAADWQPEPVNGTRNGTGGWPYTQIRAVGTLAFPTVSRRHPVEVTAQWGWAAPPAPVIQACRILAAELFSLGGAPFGVAGFGEFGVVRLRENHRAMMLLAPYQTATGRILIR